VDHGAAVPNGAGPSGLEQVAKKRSGDHWPRAVLLPVGFASDSSLIFQVFAVDRRLPSLPALVIPGPMAPALAPLSNAAAERWTAEVVRYRAGSP
jgi:hypothetical protein